MLSASRGGGGASAKNTLKQAKDNEAAAAEFWSLKKEAKKAADHGWHEGWVNTYIL